MSFGMIFSIFIIIVTIGVAIYVIAQFINTGECAKVHLFYDDVDKKVDQIWKAASSSLSFEVSVPGKVESVCFGDSGSLDSKKYLDEYEEFKEYRNTKNNLFLFPSGTCKEVSSNHVIANVDISESFCLEPKNGKIEFSLSKGVRDSLVSVKK